MQEVKQKRGLLVSLLAAQAASTFIKDHVGHSSFTNRVKSHYNRHFAAVIPVTQEGEVARRMRQLKRHQLPPTMQFEDSEHTIKDYYLANPK